MNHFSCATKGTRDQIPLVIPQPAKSARLGARVVLHAQMVLTRPQHHNRRGVPGGITFGHNMGCQLACCNPGSRQELATRRLPLPYDCRIAFLMGCSRAVPRLAEDCAPSLRRMPLEVVRRIIELCTRCAHELSPQHTPWCAR